MSVSTYRGYTLDVRATGYDQYIGLIVLSGVILETLTAGDENKATMACQKWVDIVADGIYSSAEVIAAGGSADIDLALTPKGSGVVKFGTFASGAPVGSPAGTIKLKSDDGTERWVPVYNSAP